MPRLLVLALCLLATPAFADVWIGPGALSYHTDRRPVHNEVNTGFNLEYAWNEREAVGLGVYRNSDWRETHYAAYRYTPWTVGDFKFGGLVGVADGYRPSGITPAAGLMAVYEQKHWGLNLMATPYAGGAVFALQIKWRLQ